MQNNLDYGLVASASVVTLERSTLRSNDAGGAVIINSDYTIRNTIFESNGGDQNNGEGAIVISGNSPSGVANFSFNTVLGNTYGQASALVSGVRCTGQTTPPTLSNNIVYGNVGTQQSGCNWTYSDVQGGVPGPTNINANPLFRSGGLLMPGSPCKDRGSNSGAPPFDYEGEARPNPSTGIVDMGADEIYP